MITVPDEIRDLRALKLQYENAPEAVKLTMKPKAIESFRNNFSDDMPIDLQVFYSTLVTEGA